MSVPFQKRERTGDPNHPRPQLQRAEWESLNGSWDFAIDARGEISDPAQVAWDRRIMVPFAPETTASGVGTTGFFTAVWYRREFPRPELKAGERLILHFGAVDYHATVWVNGIKVRTHEGGYTPFSVEITAVLREGEAQEVVVRAEDDPADLEKPRGKQDWKLEPHSIWYPRTTGMWQTVWMEVVPAVYIESVRWTSNLKRWEIGLGAQVRGTMAPGSKLVVRLYAGDQMLASDTYGFVQVTESSSLSSGEILRRIALSDPGIDDFRNGLLWSPASPTIIDVELQLQGPNGEVIDQVLSYTALRSVGIQGNRVVLNGRPVQLRLILDQGYWPESGQTAPNENAFVRDILLVKGMGFNGVRKHQKIEDPRFLYWADHLGLLVWEEMPSAYRYTHRSVERLTREWMEVLTRDSSHPCIISWVPFNESWGMPDLPDSPVQRAYVAALYHLTKTLDPTRPVLGNDGWESVATDIIGIHDYDKEPANIAKRYGADVVESKLFQFERPGGRLLRVGDTSGGERVQPIVLTEFGGIALRTDDESTWGYTSAHTAQELDDRYTALLTTVRSLPALAGFCYTQLTDTYQEANGLLYADRRPKVDLDKYALATMGERSEEDDRWELIWRERLMTRQR